MLVGEIMRKIEDASARLLNRDGSIQQGKIGQVDEWQKKHKIMLHWNNWYDVSFAPLFRFLRLDSDHLA